ncbi:MAG TPA: hypothetical protein VE223_04945 [Nitrososphaeraceae archaeon]|nr:hypothetical protein [Nitrososphaeraceae archaeon]
MEINAREYEKEEAKQEEELDRLCSKKHTDSFTYALRDPKR